MNTEPCTRLSVCSLGAALGCVSAVGVLLLGLLAWQFKYGMILVNLIGTLYIGYAATPMGILIGVVWALVDGFIWGALIALFYNFFHKCCTKCRNKTVSTSP